MKTNRALHNSLFGSFVLVLDGDTKNVQKINSIEKIYANFQTKLILVKSKEVILEISQGTSKVL